MLNLLINKIKNKMGLENFLFLSFLFLIIILKTYNIDLFDIIRTHKIKILLVFLVLNTMALVECCLSLHYLIKFDKGYKITNPYIPYSIREWLRVKEELSKIKDKGIMTQFYYKVMLIHVSVLLLILFTLYYTL